ncbi:MAG TPA: lipoate-protein ligase B [Rhodospirillaceae bacterium]|nr:lipoate-protein ligase B [Rhodospirillaceae bacterium]
MEWKVSQGLVPYEEALAFMDERAAAIHEGRADETVWLLEHPSLYTAGTSAKTQDLLNPQFPVFKTGRGGQYTYHGPGQRIAYVMLDLKMRQQKPDIKQYVCNLEQWIIDALQEFDIKGERRSGRIGIWVDTPQGEKKIAAIGVRVRRWVTLHGVSINVSPDLSHYAGIVPCGISEYGVTSLKDMGRDVPMEAVDEALRRQWNGVFSANDSIRCQINQP